MSEQFLAAVGAAFALYLQRNCSKSAAADTPVADQSQRPRKSKAVSRLEGSDGPSVWLEFSPLSAKCKSVNLGQGFPDWAPPDFVQAAAIAAVGNPAASVTQYTRSKGHPRLCQALERVYETKMARPMKAMDNFLVTVGSSEALFLSFQALLEPGDEVIIIEPAFDLYHAQIKMAGGVAKPVPLRSPPNATTSADFYIDMGELRRAFSEKTRIILINTPHNPTGKVFSREELVEIAKLLEEFPDCLVLLDEVYDNLVFDDLEFTHMATLPGMWDRTLTLSSIGKTFSVTGWKVGWAVGPANLVNQLAVAQQWVVFSVATCLQEAVAQALETANTPYKGYQTYYQWLTAEYTRKRQILVEGITKAGLKPIMPQGAFYVMTDTSAVSIPEEAAQAGRVQELGVEIDPLTVGLRDYNLCRWLSMSVGVTAIPPSAFMGGESKALVGHLARFCFCKDDEVLKQAVQKLDECDCFPSVE